ENNLQTPIFCSETRFGRRVSVEHLDNRSSRGGFFGRIERCQELQSWFIRNGTRAKPWNPDESQQVFLGYKMPAERRERTEQQRHVPVQFGINRTCTQPLKNRFAKIAAQFAQIGIALPIM